MKIYARAYNNRGIAYKVKGGYDRAIADYDMAVILVPMFALALTLSATGAWADWYDDCNFGEHDDVERRIRACTEVIEKGDSDSKRAEAYDQGLAYRKKDEGDKANIFVLATHNEKFMKRMCNCVLDLDTGAIKSL